MDENIGIPRDATVCDLTIAVPTPTGSKPWITYQLGEHSRLITPMHLSLATGPTERIEALTTQGAEQQQQAPRRAKP